MDNQAEKLADAILNMRVAELTCIAIEIDAIKQNGMDTMAALVHWAYSQESALRAVKAGELNG